MNGHDPLRVVVYPHVMEIGGSQMNAIDLAAAVRDLGHQVTVYAEDGPLVDRVHQHGLPYVRARHGRFRPSVTTARHLADVARRTGADVVHGYEWPPALEAYAASLGTGAVAVTTVMSMAVAPFLPAGMPLVVGTNRLRDLAAEGRTGAVTLIEPPVDVVADRPGTGGAEFRARYGIREDEVAVVVVSRLARELKLEGIVTAIRATGRLVRRTQAAVRLVVVGDGPVREVVEEAAVAANAEAGRDVVLLTGSLSDPRPAYDSADVVLGMGSSALRALSFAKPLVVQGEQGFFELLTPESTPRFLESGWYGTGSSSDDALADAAYLAALEPVLSDRGRRLELGAYGRDLVESRFSLATAAHTQVDVYRRALAARRSARAFLADGPRSAVGLVSYKVRRRAERRKGLAAADDFNARPA